MPTTEPTTNNGFLVPTSANDGTDFATGLMTYAQSVDGMWGHGTFVNRPESGTYVGQKYYATDIPAWFVWNGASWDLEPIEADSSPAWNAYTPSWTAATSAPAIANGSIGGRYKIIGKTCHFQIFIVVGNGTNGGAGAYNFGLPATAKNQGWETWVECKLYSAGPGYNYFGKALIGTGSETVQPWFSDESGGTPEPLSNSSPEDPSDGGGFPLVTGSNLFIGGTYETA